MKKHHRPILLIHVSAIQTHTKESSPFLLKLVVILIQVREKQQKKTTTIKKKLEEEKEAYEAIK